MVLRSLNRILSRDGFFFLSAGPAPRGTRSHAQENAHENHCYQPGSTRGIGLGLAEEFLKRGCRVAISSRSTQALADGLTALGAQYGVCGTACDVADIAQVQALWDAAASRFGTDKISGSVNAGVTASMRDPPGARPGRDRAGEKHKHYGPSCTVRSRRPKACWRRAVGTSTTCTDTEAMTRKYPDCIYTARPSAQCAISLKR